MPQTCILKSEKIGLSVQDGLKHLYKSGSVLDIELGDETGSTTHAHACVLAAVSPVLRNLLSQQLHQRLCFSEVSVNDWQFILDFIYLGEASIPSHHIEELYSAVIFLQITDLCDLIRLAMQKLPMYIVTNN